MSSTGIAFTAKLTYKLRTIYKISVSTMHPASSLFDLGASVSLIQVENFFFQLKANFSIKHFVVLSLIFILGFFGFDLDYINC